MGNNPNTATRREGFNPSDRMRLTVSMDAFGIHRSVSRAIIRETECWLVSTGLESMIGRLKLLKLVYLHHLAKRPFEQGSTWIAMKGDLPKGPFGSLMRGYAPDVVVHVLNMYHMFTLEDVSDAQWKKFHSSATAVQVGRTNVRACIPMGVKPWDYNQRVFQPSDYYAAFRRGLLGMALTRKSKDRRRFVARQERSWVDMCDGSSSSGVFAAEFIPQLRATRGLAPGADRFKRSATVTTHVGNLSFTQETGGKLRVFAIPDLSWQAVLEPLKLYLFRQLKRIPEDCTFDQDSGIAWALACVQQGKTLHSVDLSDATNHFPWFIQEDLLKTLRVPLVHREAMHRVAKGVYRPPSSIPGPLARIGGKDGVVFSKGQPLGAGPSFALFALAHHSVVQGLPSFDRSKDQYRILGDDIVIVDPALYSEYRALLARLTVPVSEAKSIVSDKLGEFAGALVTPRGVLKGWKWKPIVGEDLPRVLALFRRIPWQLIRKDERDAAGLLWTVMAPLGGGHNPKGIPFSNRYARLLELQEAIASSKSDTRWSTQGNTWDRLDMEYGTPSPSDQSSRQGWLNLASLLHSKVARDREIPYVRFEQSGSPARRWLDLLGNDSSSPV